MKYELLAECVVRLAETDIDNPADQKTISVCENYILESYNYYLESCEVNNLEPLSESEYMHELMLNEGFFKKLLGVAAGVGAGVAGVKAYRAGNAYQAANGGANKGFKNAAMGLKNMTQQYGAMNTMKNVARTSGKAKVAQKQYKGASTNTNVTTGKTTMDIASRKQSGMFKNPVGQHTVSYDRHGTTTTVDASSQQGQNILAGQQKMQQAQQANTPETRAAKAKAQSTAAKAETNQIKKDFGGGISNKEAEEWRQIQQKENTAIKNQQKSQQGQIAAAEKRQKADEARKAEEAAHQAQYKAELERRKAEKLQKQAAMNEAINEQFTYEPNSPEWLECEKRIQSLEEEINVLDEEINVLTEELAIFDSKAKPLSEPLTGAVRCSAKFI